MSGRGVDAFAVLGLPYDPDLTDEHVHDAYRLRLRAVHPDSGGDEVRAAAVTAAYTALRSGVRRADLLGAVSLGVLAGDGTGPEGGAGLAVTDAGTLERIGELVTAAGAGERVGPPRGEAVAFARAGAPPRGARGDGAGWLVRGWLRLRWGRPAMLAARAGVAALVPVVGWAAAPGYPVWPGLAVGAATWLVLTAQWDLAPRGRR